MYWSAALDLGCENFYEDANFTLPEWSYERLRKEIGNSFVLVEGHTPQLDQNQGRNLTTESAHFMATAVLLNSDMLAKYKSVVAVVAPPEDPQLAELREAAGIVFPRPQIMGTALRLPVDDVELDKYKETFYAVKYEQSLQQISMLLFVQAMTSLSHPIIADVDQSALLFDIVPAPIEKDRKKIELVKKVFSWKLEQMDLGGKWHDLDVISKYWHDTIMNFPNDILVEFEDAIPLSAIIKNLSASPESVCKAYRSGVPIEDILV